MRCAARPVRAARPARCRAEARGQREGGGGGGAFGFRCSLFKRENRGKGCAPDRGVGRARSRGSLCRQLGRRGTPYAGVPRAMRGAAAYPGRPHCGVRLACCSQRRKRPPLPYALCKLYVRRFIRCAPWPRGALRRVSARPQQHRHRPPTPAIDMRRGWEGAAWSTAVRANADSEWPATTRQLVYEAHHRGRLGVKKKYQ